MLPVLSHVERVNDLEFYITTDAIVGCAFYMEACDLESAGFEEYRKRLVQVLNRISPKILVRVRMDAVIAHDLDPVYPRAAALNDMGFVRKSVKLFLDYRGGIHSLNELKRFFGRGKSNPGKQFSDLHEAVSLFKNNGFKLTPFSKKPVEDLFEKSAKGAWVRGERSIEAADRSIGAIRLRKYPADSMALEKWAKILDKLPKPFSVHVSFQRLDEVMEQGLLARAHNQESSGKSIQSKVKTKATESVIEDSFENGVHLYYTEVVVTLERGGLESLSAAIRPACSDLSMFSESEIETYGLAPTFIGTWPGSAQHVTVLETEAPIAALLPLWFSGRVSDEAVKPERALTLLREDRSTCHFDLFNPKYNVFNALISGTSGKGKSVLTGLLTTSLLNDPKNKIIKVDVKGSHSKECELYGGIEYQISLENPSGINPLDVINHHDISDNDKLGLVSTFLGTLIREQGEVVLSKTLRSGIEDSVRVYIDSKPKNANLDGFYKSAKDFPRRELLKRWVKGGLYENAYGGRAEGGKPVAESELVQFRAVGAPHSSRLRYYNFANIFQAADPEFAQGGMAAVLAQFNLELLKSDGSNIILMCDETPFFIKACFDFFKFTTANIRKHGAVVLIAQVTSDFIVNGDTGIIDNSPQRFFFSVDGDDAGFKNRFNFKDQHIKKIRELQSLVGIHSEVVLESPEEFMKLIIKVTPEEYWRLTTSKVDQTKLSELMLAVKGLSLREAIRCLATP